MIWFLERPGERLQCEIRCAPKGSGYELVWTTEDGRTHVEWSKSPEDLLQRRRSVEDRLRLDGWLRPGRTTPPQVALVPRIPD